MDSTVAAEVADLAKIRQLLVRDVVMPVEVGLAGAIHYAPDELRRDLKSKAKAAGLREIRPFRIDDGPSDVHRWEIARRTINRRRRRRRRAIASGERPRREAPS